MQLKAYPEVPHDAGEVIFREGDAGTVMYVIESGEVEISRSTRGQQPVALLGPGDFFGEMAILEDQPRFATATARTACVLRAVDREAFASLLREDLETTVRIMRNFAGRLRQVEAELAEQTQAHGQLRQRLSAPTVQRPAVAAPAAEAREVQVTRELPPQAPPLPRWRLRHGGGMELPVRSGVDELLVGRPDPVTGTIPEINLGVLDTQRMLSRRHAKLLIDGATLFLREEVGVTNGTFVNGQRLRTGVAHPLKPGDTLRFGNIELMLERP
jgi:CRP-like cAMP-binding protein